MRRQNGLGLLELVIIVAIIAIIALCAAPSFGSYRRRASVVSQANELREIFRAVRSRAIARSNHAGVKFVRSGDQLTMGTATASGPTTSTPESIRATPARRS